MARNAAVAAAAIVAAVTYAAIFTPVPTDAAPWSSANAAWNVNFNPDGSDPSKYFGKWDGHVYYPSPDDWRKESVYQFITDRFGDGTPENNEGTYSGYDVTQIGARHGGDFKGIQERLDYIKSLGYTSIWISPIFQNFENSYHGYGQNDLTLLDERFGTLQEFRDMVDAAHQRGIKVIVDYVANHLSDLYYFEGFQNKATPFRLHSGEYRLIQRNPNRSYTDFKVDNNWDPNYVYPTLYNDLGYASSDPGPVKGSFSNSDLHHNGDLGRYDDIWQNVLGKIYGSLDDLRTTHPRVVNKIIAMTKALISSTDIDGIRMDTPMQLPASFFQAWAPAVRAHAKTLGKNNFMMFGEYYCSPERASTMTGRGHTKDQWGNPFAFIGSQYMLDSGLYYPFYNALNTILDQRNELRGLKTLLDRDLKGNAFDFYNPTNNRVEYRHLNFHSNHDQWRVSTRPDGLAKVRLGTAIIALWPGIPAFYYGDEQGFSTPGTALDGWAREDFMTSLAWRDYPDVTGKRNSVLNDNFDMTHPQFLFTQRVQNIRRQYWNLQTCDTVEERWAQPGNTNGIYAFTRMCGSNPNDWVLVLFNSWSQPLSAATNGGKLFTGWPQGRIVNAFREVDDGFGRDEYFVGADSALASSITLGGYEVKVLVRADGYKNLNPVVWGATPKHDDRAARDAMGAVTVSFSFSQPMAQATVLAALRVNGAAVSNSTVETSFSSTGKDISLKIKGLSDGIHKVGLTEQAVSRLGGALYGAYSLRFRVGGDDNVICNPARNFVLDTTLITNVNRTSDGVFLTLRHKAAGAAKLRLVNNMGASVPSVSTPWQAYAVSTTHKVAPAGWGTGTIIVQYWADSSAAYYTKATF